MDSKDPSSPHLLGIPRETRLQIYKLLIRDGKLIITVPWHGPHLQEALIRLHLGRTAQGNQQDIEWDVNACTSIMQVCKALRMETLELFFEATTMFQVPCAYQLRSITDSTQSPLQYVKVLQITQNKWDPEFDYDILPSLEIIHVKDVRDFVQHPSLGGNDHDKFVKRVRAANDNYGLKARKSLIKHNEFLAMVWGQERAEKYNLFSHFDKIKPGILCVADFNLASYTKAEFTEFSIVDTDDAEILAMAVSDFSHTIRAITKIDR
jgi:hypothetical protein